MKLATPETFGPYKPGDIVIIIETGEAGIIEHIRPPIRITWPRYERYDFPLPVKYTLNMGKRRPSRWYGAEELRHATPEDPVGLMLVVAVQMDEVLSDLLDKVKGE